MLAFFYNIMIRVLALVLMMTMTAFTGEMPSIYNAGALDYINDPVSVSQSPNGSYTVRVYTVEEGGYMSPEVTSVFVTAEGGTLIGESEIYYRYDSRSAEVEWIDDDTVKIADIELDVETDSYSCYGEDFGVKDESFRRAVGIYPSPDGEYFLKAVQEFCRSYMYEYTHISVDLHNSENGWYEFTVYVTDTEAAVSVEWLTNTVAVINGHELDVFEDYFSSISGEENEYGGEPGFMPSVQW